MGRNVNWGGVVNYPSVAGRWLDDVHVTVAGPSQPIIVSSFVTQYIIQRSFHRIVQTALRHKLRYINVRRIVFCVGIIKIQPRDAIIRPIKTCGPIRSATLSPDLRYECEVTMSYIRDILQPKAI